MDTQVEVVGLPKHAWVLWLVMGFLSVVIGTWLVFSPEAAIATLTRDWPLSIAYLHWRDEADAILAALEHDYAV